MDYPALIRGRFILIPVKTSFSHPCRSLLFAARWSIKRLCKQWAKWHIHRKGHPSAGQAAQ
jgi:hypothetical protein